MNSQLLRTQSINNKQKQVEKYHLPNSFGRWPVLWRVYHFFAWLCLLDFASTNYQLIKICLESKHGLLVDSVTGRNGLLMDEMPWVAAFSEIRTSFEWIQAQNSGLSSRNLDHLIKASKFNLSIYIYMIPADSWPEDFRCSMLQEVGYESVASNCVLRSRRIGAFRTIFPSEDCDEKKTI